MRHHIFILLGLVAAAAGTALAQAVDTTADVVYGRAWAMRGGPSTRFRGVLRELSGR